MANPTPARFRRAILFSFAVCTVLYLSTSIASVARLGGTVTGDVLTNFRRGVANDFGLVSVTVHLLVAAVTVHIPVGHILDHDCGATELYKLGARQLGTRQLRIRVTTMAGRAGDLGGLRPLLLRDRARGWRVQQRGDLHLPVVALPQAAGRRALDGGAAGQAGRNHGDRDHRDGVRADRRRTLVRVNKVTREEGERERILNVESVEGPLPSPFPHPCLNEILSLFNTPLL